MVHTANDLAPDTETSKRRTSVMIAQRLAGKSSGRDPRHAAPLEILVVDDDDATRLSLAYALADAGHKVCEACDGEEALARLGDHTFDVALVDIRLPKVDGLAVFRKVRQLSPSTAVILMTAFATVPDAVASLREGAYDYVTKPFDPEELTLRVIGHIAEHRALRQELEEARRLVASRDAGAPIVGSTPVMVQLVERINTVAQSDAPVLIRGESGTGKALVAHTLHARGPRKNAPFVAMSCSAFPEALVDGELFGRATPGVGRTEIGRMEAADGGTLMLDEISELPLPSQAKLLRVLEDGEIPPSGGGAGTRTNVRIITASNRDLKELVAQGKFRRDLYFRINVVDLAIPPLRERLADMPLLVAHFLRRFYPGRVPPSIAPRAWTAIMSYAWPGNVRELAHAVERAVVLSHGNEIDIEHLPPDLAATSADAEPISPLPVAMKEFERQYLKRAMDRAKGNSDDTARLLGLSPKDLDEKLKEHGLRG
jgi:DNA-binding NtrC family response regulator